MRWQGLVRTMAAAVALVTSGACASTPDPWRSHQQSADVKAILADAGRSCSVVVHNGTGQLVEALVDVAGVDRSLGLLADGQSTAVDVACSERRVHAKGIAQTLGLSEGVRFSKTALLDVTRETRLRFTASDRARW